MEFTQKEKEQAFAMISKKIIDTVYNTILLEMRFIDIALAKLTPKPSEEVKYLATNGKYLFYNEGVLIKTYKQDPNKVAHDVIHTLLHCIFMHLFYVKSNPLYLNLACDIAVEQLISTIDIPSLKTMDKEKLETIKIIEDKVSPITPHNIIAFLQNEKFTSDILVRMAEMFKVDDHKYWYMKSKDNKNNNGEGDGEDDNGEDGEFEEMSLETFNSMKMSQSQLEDLWKDVSRSVELNMESFNKFHGDRAGSLKQHLKQLNREKYDYTNFLRKFANKQEETKVNPDEFDYVFYTYGLNIYDNMPLIEPLEYKDSYLITDFVIAIDTSGSTSGPVVQDFLQKTYNILKSSESFSKKINLCIIQCDALIQDVVHITSEEEFDSYIKNLTIKGLGGTDFRPVFSLVKDLISAKAFTKLKGLIYFTDGYGEFPKEKTPYDTAFVFVVPEDYENVRVPPWAMKILLTENEIREFRENGNI